MMKPDREMLREFRRGIHPAELAKRYGMKPIDVWRLCEPKFFGITRPPKSTPKRVALARRREEARRLWMQGVSGKDLSEMFDVSRSTVSGWIAGLPSRDRYGNPRATLRHYNPEEITWPCPRRKRPSSTRRQTQVGPIARPPHPGGPLELNPMVRGCDHPKAVLNEDLVIEMRRLRREGWKTTDLAKRYGIGRNTVCYALSGKTWRHVPGWISK